MDMVARFRVARAVGGREGMAGMMTAVVAAAREVWVRSDWDLSQENTVFARPGIAVSETSDITDCGDSVLGKCKCGGKLVKL
jgi:aspartate oxidase